MVFFIVKEQVKGKSWHFPRGHIGCKEGSRWGLKLLRTTASKHYGIQEGVSWCKSREVCPISRKYHNL